MRRLLVRTLGLLPVIALFAVPATTSSMMVSAFDYSKLSAIQQKELSGFARQALTDTLNTASPRAAARANYLPTSDDGCPVNRGNNIKTNQNCLNISRTAGGGAQAQNETTIAADPLQPDHLMAAWNDYRRGPSNCIGSFSRDGGRTWTDTIVPMAITASAEFGPGSEYWTEAGDPAVAWDTKHNVYYACLMFNRGKPASNNPDQSSGIYVFRSTGNGGASWNYPGRPVSEHGAVSGEDFFGQFLEDKPYVTVDTHPDSPFRDRIYVTWTEYLPDGSATVWESHSNNYGQSFSPRTLVSGDSRLCVNDFGAGTPFGRCNAGSFSQPFTGPDGALYVVWANFNTAAGLPGHVDNRFQVLLVKSTDGGQSFSAPVKVSDYYELPDCATYQGGQDFGVACVPEKGSSMKSLFRATNYPVGDVNPRNPSEVAVTIGSYINQHSKESNGCVPAGINPATIEPLYTGVKTPGACNNDILLSVSTDGGASFSGATTDPRTETAVTQESGQAATDQFWQWAGFTRDGTLAVSYYDRQYGADETTGFNDMSLSGSSDLEHFAARRVTSGSNPPTTQFLGGFLGDYSGLAVTGDEAHPLWTDTRDEALFICPGTGAPGVPPQLCTGPGYNGDPANDQDVFSATLRIPTGEGGGDSNH